MTQTHTHVVFKYEADENGTYLVPDSLATVLLVAQQDDSPFPKIWCRVRTDNGLDLVKRRFQCVGTGYPVDSHDIFVGSAVCGPFVWHVIDLGPQL